MFTFLLRIFQRVSIVNLKSSKCHVFDIGNNPVGSKYYNYLIILSYTISLKPTFYRLQQPLRCLLVVYVRRFNLVISNMTIYKIDLQMYIK